MSRKVDMLMSAVAFAPPGQEWIAERALRLELEREAELERQYQERLRKLDRALGIVVK